MSRYVMLNLLFCFFYSHALKGLVNITGYNVIKAVSFELCEYEILS